MTTEEDKTIKTYYSVVAPGTIRPNSEYHVVVSVHETDEPANIEVGIESKFYSQSKIVKLKPYSTEIVKFDIPNIQSDNYNLTAKGLENLKFDSKKAICFENKAYVIMIQTDKATYKPGDLVGFRAIILDRFLKPTKINGLIDIRIEDPDQNTIKLMKDVKLNTGVYIDELQLPTFPQLGCWQIFVDVNGQIESKSFEVDEYVLPRFEVSIDSPNVILFKDGKLYATVRAKYTYGKPVKGEAIVTVNPSYNTEAFKVEKTIPVDGKGQVEFDIKKDFKYEYEYEESVTIKATFEEKLTGIKQSASKDVVIHSKEYKIECVTKPYVYKPDESFELSVKVSKYDNSEVQDTENAVILVARFNENEHKTIEFKQLLNKNGVAKFDITLPKAQNSVEFTAKYKDHTGFIGYIYLKAETPPRNDFHIDVKTENPRNDEEFVFDVNSPNDMKYFVYQIVARGYIQESKLVEVPNAKYHTVKIQPTSNMGPVVELFVYMVVNGDLISDERTINFPKKLDNFVDIDLPEKAKPGEEIDIKIKTKPNSFVGLLGVDQSVLLHSSGNDLTADQAFDKALAFRCYVNRYGAIPGYGSGVILLTNAKYPVEEYIKEAKCRKRIIKKRKCSKERELIEVMEEEQIKIRSEFPETWIWNDFSVLNDDGTVSLHKKVPDTITTWMLTGFSIDPVYGFGLTENAEELEVFQPFFVSTNLPYSVKRGEVIAIPIAVFNYMETNLDAEITLNNEYDEFEFAEKKNEIDKNSKDGFKRTKPITIASNSGESVSFVIRPTKAGNIKIKVIAKTPIASDGIEQVLLVEPEGVTEYVNKPVFIDLRKNAEQMEMVKIEIPENAVPDSTYIEVSVIGDILGPTISNLDKLVRKPYGCGEQNMVNFVPNILVLYYLEKIGQLKPDIVMTAKKFLEIGYQSELTYKHPDGSYSAFGTSDKSGSTWLTAYVARSFRQATKYTHVDESIIEAALNFLASKQIADGSFPEVGMLFDKHEGGTDNDVALTAFTVLAFLESAEKIPNYKENINKALQFLAKKCASSNDLYAIAISAYAFQLAKHSAKDSLLDKLESQATKDVNKKYWHKPIPKSDNDCYWYCEPMSVDIEMTSYALLALLESGRDMETLPILKWLISQRNSNGGFSSTQDTVVGLQALIKCAEKLFAKDNNVEVSISNGEEIQKKLTINSGNAFVLQSQELPSIAKEVSLKATGNGIAIAQVSYRYNLNNPEPQPSFAIQPKIDSVSNSEHLKMTVCATYLPNVDGLKESNMAVMEINFPSGFTIENRSIKDLQRTDRVMRVETKNGDSVVILYFNNLDSTEVCPIVEAYKTHKVAEQKPSPIVVYDYYDSTRQARVFYDAPNSSLSNEGDGIKCA